MMLTDIGTMSPSGRKTNVYMTASDEARAEVPDDHPEPDNAARRSLMLYLAEREWKAGETIIQARHRMREYLRETPPVRIGTGRELASGLETIIYAEG